MPRAGQQAADFDRVARVYRWAEFLCLGPLLTRSREHFLPHMGQSRQALLFGDGDGRFLRSLLRRNAAIQAIAVDTSSSMLSLLLRRCGTQRVRALQASALTLDLQHFPRPDLVISHFFLDCLENGEVEALVNRVSLHATPDALWVISDFALPRRQPWRWLGSVYVHALYVAFGLLTGLQVRHLPRHAEPLRAGGFECIARHEWLQGLVFSELWLLTGNRQQTTSPPVTSSTLR